MTTFKLKDLWGYNKKFTRVCIECFAGIACYKVKDNIGYHRGLVFTAKDAGKWLKGKKVKLAKVCNRLEPKEKTKK